MIKLIISENREIKGDIIMGVFDIFKTKGYKEKIQELENNITVIKNKEKSIEQMTFLELNEEIERQKKDLNTIENEVEKQKNSLSNVITAVNNKEDELIILKKNLIVVEDDIEVESYGLYVPKYNFANAMGYKEKLNDIRLNQKKMIKEKTAVNYSDNWTVDGSKVKGKKMTNDNIKQILRSFNNECEASINKIKYSNVHTIENRIRKSFEQLNKLNQSQKINLTTWFLDLKIAELYLAYEYERKKEEEKQELREQREKEKEEKALQKEIQSKKKIIDKDITHYEQLIIDLRKKLAESIDKEENKSVSDQIEDLEGKVLERTKDKEELDYRTAHAYAGYVYIISNIGAFGEGVFKIGVTRRLEPLERISELSSASVPFKFDVHALIFSYDAYKLETELHTYFEKYRMNKVNNRKEFFEVPIRKIEEKLKEYGELTIDFSKDAEAEEYRQSINIK